MEYYLLVVMEHGFRPIRCSSEEIRQKMYSHIMDAITNNTFVAFTTDETEGGDYTLVVNSGKISHLKSFDDRQKMLNYLKVVFSVQTRETKESTDPADWWKFGAQEDE